MGWSPGSFLHTSDSVLNCNRAVNPAPYDNVRTKQTDSIGGHQSFVFGPASEPRAFLASQECLGTVSAVLKQEEATFKELCLFSSPPLTNCAFVTELELS